MMLNRSDFIEAMGLIVEMQKSATEISFAPYDELSDERKYDLFLSEATRDTIEALVDQGFALELYGGKLRIAREE